MRTFILISFLLATAATKAQTFLPGSYIDLGYRGNPASNIRFNDSALNKKWSVSRYSSLSTSFSFFKGGSATVVAAPIGLQLNRRLNNNFYAFAGASIAPAYVSLRSSFLNASVNKPYANAPFNQNSLGLYSRAELGLMYVNDARTFSISGSIGIERSNMPLPYYGQYSKAYQSNNPQAIKR